MDFGVALFVLLMLLAATIQLYRLTERAWADVMRALFGDEEETNG